MSGWRIRELVEGTRHGMIGPLTGPLPTWRMGDEPTPFYDSMLADGFRSPWLADDPGVPCVLLRAEVVE